MPKRKRSKQSYSLASIKGWKTRRAKQKLFSPKGRAVTRLRKAVATYKSKTLGTYAVDLYRKHKKGKIVTYKKIPLEDFTPGQWYRVYLRHKKTGIKRLLSFGKLHDLPIVSKRHTQDLDKPVLLGGRRFRPLSTPKKARGKWVPTWRIVKSFELELETQKKDLNINFVAGSILPIKRFYHSDWHIFSDFPMKGSDRVRDVFVNASIVFDYPGKSWVSKRNVKLELDGSTMIRNLVKHETNIEDMLNMELEKEFRLGSKASVSVVQVNGFIPIK
jgi:hypothetical protein